MKWYQNIDILQNSDNKRYYKNNLYPDIPLSADDSYIISVSGDRYDLLAFQYYKDVSLWRVIPMANNLSCDSLFPPPGLQLRIPASVEDVLKEYADLNKG
jgi:hypothetical protein